MEEYQLCKNIREEERLRNSFFALSEAVYGLSYREWYREGYWTGRYQPYVITDGRQVLANASANRIDTVCDGVKKHLIQIGTVMTHPDFRNRGLSRRVIGEILLDWKDRCDGIYLYANDSVLDFYPKFGFSKETEYQYTLYTGRSSDAGWEKLDMSLEASRSLLQKYYQMSNPHALLPMLDNFGLLMFYCGAFMKDCLYYSQRLDAVCVAAQEERAVQLFDVFGMKNGGLQELAEMLPFEKYDRVVLGFTPQEQACCSCARLEEEDTTLFVYREKENIFAQGKVRMPELSHA